MDEVYVYVYSRMKSMSMYILDIWRTDNSLADIWPTEILANRYFLDWNLADRHLVQHLVDTHLTDTHQDIWLTDICQADRHLTGRHLA